MDDQKIIELLFERLESALIEIQKKYHKLCLKVSFDIVGTQPDCEECVNDSYWKLWNSVPPNRPNSLRAYLLRIVKNLSLDVLRKKHAKKRSTELELVYEELEECISDLTRVEQEENLKDVINQFLCKLDPNNRRIFLKRYWYTKSIMVIAEEEGLKESTIKMRLLRLRNQLKSELEKEHFL